MIHLEIFDERAFAVDDRIAWADIVISPQMLEGTITDVIDDWSVMYEAWTQLDIAVENVLLAYSDIS